MPNTNPTTLKPVVPERHLSEAATPNGTTVTSTGTCIGGVSINNSDELICRLLD